MKEGHDPDRVGYKKPPKHTRWKKGQCGNPNRVRSKVPKRICDVVDDLFAQEINIVKRGVRQRVTVFEAISLQLLLKGISGDKRAMNALFKYRKFAGEQDGEVALEICFVPNDESFKTGEG